MTSTADRPERASESRLEVLREEAARTGSVAAPGARVAGGPIPRAAGYPGASSGHGAAADLQVGYYGRPIVKPAVWTWEIPLYFFVGGSAGMAAVVAAAARFGGAEADLVRAALWLGVAGALVSPLLLILDLGRPSRFLNMLRVFKWRSPMSMGAWILVAFSGAVTAAALLEWTLRASPRLTGGGAGMGAAGILLDASLFGAAATGALLATYTGVLIGATATPAWHTHHRSLPVHFGIAGLGSAVGALTLLGFRLPALTALGMLAAGVEIAFGAWIELRRHGAADRALRDGVGGWTLRVAGLLAGPVSFALWIWGPASWAAGAFLVGALASRYGWLWAGRASASDPEAALATSR